jgi:hypothetical protein
VSAVRKQVGHVAATVAVVVAALSGCGGPEQAGSAVIVGDEAVPLAQVQEQLGTAVSRRDGFAQYSQIGGTSATLARSIVGEEVMHILLERRAAAEGIVVTDAQVDAALSGDDGQDADLAELLYDEPTRRELERDRLIAAEIGRRLASGLAVTVDIVAVTTRDTAEQTARTLAAGGPGAEAVFAQNPSNSERGGTYQAATSPGEAETVVFGVPVGTVGYFQPNPGQSGWIVYRVLDHRTDVPVDPAAVSSLSEAQLVGIGKRGVQADADALGVRVNPRYGEWDPIQLTVVPDDQQSGGTILPQAPAAG